MAAKITNVSEPRSEWGCLCYLLGVACGFLKPITEHKFQHFVKEKNISYNLRLERK